MPGVESSPRVCDTHCEHVCSPYIPRHHQPREDPEPHSRGNEARPRHSRSLQSLGSYKASYWPHISTQKILIEGASCSISFSTRVTSFLPRQFIKFIRPLPAGPIAGGLGEMGYSHPCLMVQTDWGQEQGGVTGKPFHFQISDNSECHTSNTFARLFVCLFLKLVVTLPPTQNELRN